MTSKIVAVILVTGEELIGSVVEKLHDSTKLYLEKPRVVAIMRNQQG